MILSGAELGEIAGGVPEVARFFNSSRPATPTEVKIMVDKIMKRPDAPPEPNRRKLLDMINYLNARRRGVTLH